MVIQNHPPKRCNPSRKYRPNATLQARYTKRHPKPIQSGPLHPSNALGVTHLYRDKGYVWCGELADTVPHTEIDDHCNCFECQDAYQYYIDSFESRF